jgi:23S rRNA pseudouridine1911/1915/1917 synthase
MSTSRWTWTVTPEASDERADRAIPKAIDLGEGTWDGPPQECSRSRLQKLIEGGAVSTNGRIIVSSAKLGAGTRIEVRFPEPVPLEAQPEDRPIDILFQDEHLLVVNKPQGISVHPSASEPQGTLVNALLHHMRTGTISGLSSIGGVERPGIVHRLDKDTSGALLITKSDVAHQRMAEIFAKHDIDRVYWALCYGHLEAPERRIESLLDRNPKDRMRMSMTVTEGRRAVTFVRRLEEYGLAGKRPFASWAELRLETGRTHQIRVHLDGQGNSVLGDPLYGAPGDRNTKWLALPEPVRELVAALPGQALHARTLGFVHPVTGAKMHFEAEPPKSFNDLLTELKKNA